MWRRRSPAKLKWAASDRIHIPGSYFERLASSIQAGGRAAEEELVGMFQSRVLGVANANTRDPDLAQELTQEVFWAVLRLLRL